MKKIFSIFIGITIINSFFIGTAFANTIKVKKDSLSYNNLKIGMEFNMVSGGINVDKNSYILDFKSGDVTGDKANDMVILLGTKENKKQIFCDKINLIIQDGKTKKYTIFKMPNSGYDKANLFLGDFNQDKIKDIMVSIPNGGSDGTSSYGIYSFVKNKPLVIFDMNKLSEGLKFKGNYKDNYEAGVRNTDTNTFTNIDLSSKKSYYKQMSIYDEKGKLLKDVSICTEGYSVLKPIDYDGDGSYELEGYQSLWGVSHTDTISNAKSVWDYENGKWKIKVLELSALLVNNYNFN